MNQQHMLSGLSLACLALLGGCGGGGGGDGGPAAVSPTPPPAASSPLPSPVVPSTPPPATAGEVSMIPEPGIGGAVLYADAAPLRVLGSGALWTYRGTDQPAGTATGITYANKVSVSSADGLAYAEQSTNLFNNGGDTTGGMRFENGSYKFAALINYLKGGAKLTETMTELRSPVRANDLYGGVERKNVDIGADLDGDGVNETASVAAYSRVVAKETVDLPNRRHVEAVRVDLTIRVRVTPSKTKLASAVQEAVQSTWYAPGIGIIKRRLEEPSLVAGRQGRVVTEVLEQWDGVTEGLGFLPTQMPAAAASSPLAGSKLQFPHAAVSFDTHAVVLANKADARISDGIVLAQIDGRGQVMAARNYAYNELFPGSDFLTELRLLRTGDSLWLTARRSDNTVGLLRLDATGQRILGTPATIVDNRVVHDRDGTSYRVASEGFGFWTIALQPTVDANGRPLTYANVGRTDGFGRPQSEARAIILPVDAVISDLNMVLDGNKLVFSWRETNGQSVLRVATMDIDSMVVTRGTIDMAADACIRADLVALQPGVALACSNYADTPVSAARIVTNGQVLLGNGAPLAAEALQTSWLSTLKGQVQFTGSKGEFNLVAPQYGAYWPGDAESSFTAVIRTDSAGGAPPREPALLARIREMPRNLRFTVPVGNSLVLIGSDANDYMTTTTVWLPK